MQKNFVTFLSPGTITAEQTTQPIESWDQNLAIKLSEKIVERHNARPYGFYFTTRERKDNELDSHEIARSPMYYLGGEVFTLKQLQEIGDPKNAILIKNMECNGWDCVIINKNSWQWTQPLLKGDVVLPYTPKSQV